MTSNDDNVVASEDANNIPPVDVDDTSSQDDVKTDKEGSLSDIESNTLNKLADMTEDEQNEKLSTMEATGRAESAAKLRSILGIEKPVVIPNIDEEAVASYLERQGLDKKTIEEFKQTKQERERQSIADKWKSDTGIEIDIKSESFLKNYYNKELASLPVNLRTEVALTRTYGVKKDDTKKEEKASSMTGLTKGQKQEPTNWDSLPASEKLNRMRSMTLDQLS